MERSGKLAKHVVAVLVLFAAAGWAGAEQLTFQEGVNGYASAADTWLWSHGGSVVSERNYGGSAKMTVAYPWSTCSQKGGLVYFGDLFGSLKLVFGAGFSST